MREQGLSSEGFSDKLRALRSDKRRIRVAMIKCL